MTKRWRRSIECRHRNINQRDNDARTRRQCVANALPSKRYEIKHLMRDKFTFTSSNETMKTAIGQQQPVRPDRHREPTYSVRHAPTPLLSGGYVHTRPCMDVIWCRWPDRNLNMIALTMISLLNLVVLFMSVFR